MHKKILLKITLLLSNVSMHATQRTRAFLCAARTFKTIQKARYITPLLNAIAQDQIEVAQALLEQGNQNLFILHPDTGYSLAFIAINNNNKNLVSLLHQYGARLLPNEKDICVAYQEYYPGFFKPYAPEFCSIF